MGDIACSVSPVHRLILLWIMLLVFHCEIFVCLKVTKVFSYVFFWKLYSFRFHV